MDTDIVVSDCHCHYLPQKNVLLTPGWCDQLRVGVWLRGGHARRLHQVPHKTAMVTIFSTNDPCLSTICFKDFQVDIDHCLHRTAAYLQWIETQTGIMVEP